MAVPVEATWRTTDSEGPDRGPPKLSTTGFVPSTSATIGGVSGGVEHLAGGAQRGRCADSKMGLENRAILVAKHARGYKEGRGRLVGIAAKPLGRKTKTGKWRRRHWTFWQRFQDALDQKNVIKPRRWRRRLMDLLQDVEKHWHVLGDGAMGQFCEAATSWIQGIDDGNRDEISRVVNQQLVLTHTEALEYETMYYKEWLQSLKGGEGLW